MINLKECETELSDESLDHDYNDQSLNIFLSLLIQRLDIAMRRRLVALFLEMMGSAEKRNPLDASKSYAGVPLSEESKYRARGLVEQVEMIFSEILPPKQEELYQKCINLRETLGHDTTPEGYIDFLNLCHHLFQLTRLPFSLEEDFGGLKTWEAWDIATEKAVEECKQKYAVHE